MAGVRGQKFGNAPRTLLLWLGWLLALNSFAQAQEKGCFSDLKQDPQKLIDLPNEYHYDVLLKVGQKMTDGKPFPQDPDLTVYLPLSSTEAYLIISHEIAPDFDKVDPAWKWAGALTRHHLINDQIKESKLLAGNMRNNCSGSLTPWGTVLTNEEFPRQPYEKYPNEGYVWEVNPLTEKKFKRQMLGRFSHESSVVAPDGSVYLTEDDRPGFLYRFLPAKKRDLSSGKLLAYNRDAHSWVAIEKPLMAHEEAKTQGATAFNRLEGLSLSQDGQTLFIAETGEDKHKPDPYGRILKLNLKDFNLQVFHEGNPKTMINPDNLVSDQKDNLWALEDRFDKNVLSYGLNNIWRISADGKTCLFAKIADYECEPTGPTFDPDSKNLYLNLMCGKKGFAIRITGF